MRDARKLFRLFKSVNEAKKIKDLTNGVLDINLGLNILIRGFFLLYWFFDNLNILSKIKLLDFDPKKMAKIGSTFWLIALVTNLILLVRNLLANLKKCSDLKKYPNPYLGSTTLQPPRNRPLNVRKNTKLPCSPATPST